MTYPGSGDDHSWVLSKISLRRKIGEVEFFDRLEELIVTELELGIWLRPELLILELLQGSQIVPESHPPFFRIAEAGTEPRAADKVTEDLFPEILVTRLLFELETSKDSIH